MFALHSTAGKKDQMLQAGVQRLLAALLDFLSQFWLFDTNMILSNCDLHTSINNTNSIIIKTLKII